MILNNIMLGMRNTCLLYTSFEVHALTNGAAEGLEDPMGMPAKVGKRIC